MSKIIASKSPAGNTRWVLTYRLGLGMNTSTIVVYEFNTLDELFEWVLPRVHITKFKAKRVKAQS